MGELGKLHQLIISFMGYDLAFNLEVILMTWIVIATLIFFGVMSSRKRALLPGPVQVLGELFVSALYKLTEDALDEEMAKKYGPLTIALFMFLLLSNWLGIIPHLGEPTKDLNTPLSLGIMGFLIAHHAGIKTKGERLAVFILELPGCFLLVEEVLLGDPPSVQERAALASRHQNQSVKPI